MTEAKVTIGHIARAAGVNIETVGYRQRRGLVNLSLKEVRRLINSAPRERARRTARSRHRSSRSLKKQLWI
jgi:hypothetical protein